MLAEEVTAGFTRAVRAKRTHARGLLARKNVVACGVGYKIRNGVLLEEPVVIVGVTHKVPKAQLAPRDVVPQSLDSVQTDVQEVGRFRAWQLSPTDRHRPAVPGISCGHVDVTAGTLGCLVRRGNELFILSNNHVLANTGQASQGDPILQPARYDGGTLDDQIATLAEWVPLQTSTGQSDCTLANLAANALNLAARASGSDTRLHAVTAQQVENKVDAALARPLAPGLVGPEILGVGLPRGVRQGTLGTQVQKSGRTTGVTTGRIMQVDVTVNVDYLGENVTFTGQFMATGMSSGGDSGSVVLDMERYVVGLLFAGSNMATLINPIQLVLGALNVEVVSV
jgi:hypothetical protein